MAWPVEGRPRMLPDPGEGRRSAGGGSVARRSPVRGVCSTVRSRASSIAVVLASATRWPRPRAVVAAADGGRPARRQL